MAPGGYNLRDLTKVLTGAATVKEMANKRMGKKKHGSKTKVNKNRENEGALNDLHSGVTSSVHNMHLNHKRPRGVMSETNFRYVEINSVVCTNTAEGGEQKSYTIGAACTAQQCLVTTGTPAGATTGVFEGGVALIEQNPFTTNTGSNYIGSVTVPLNTSIFVKNITFQLNLVNLENIGVQIEVYWVTPKLWSNTEPVDDWTNALGQEAFGKTGITKVINNVASTMHTGAMNVNVPGARPTHCDEWRKRYRVMKVNHLDLGAGATEQLHYMCKTNLTVRKDVILEQNGVPTTVLPTNANLARNPYMREATIFCFLIIRGQPVADVNGAANGAPGSISYGIHKVGAIFNKRYNMHPLMGNASKSNTAFAGVNINQTMVPADGKIMDIVDASSVVEQVT